MMAAQEAWKLAKDLKAGDVIQKCFFGRWHELVVSDVRHVCDDFVHVDTGDGTATSIYLLDDVVFLSSHAEAASDAQLSSEILDNDRGGDQNRS